MDISNLTFAYKNTYKNKTKSRKCSKAKSTCCVFTYVVSPSGIRQTTRLSSALILTESCFHWQLFLNPESFGGLERNEGGVPSSPLTGRVLVVFGVPKHTNDLYQPFLSNQSIQGNRFTLERHSERDQKTHEAPHRGTCTLFSQAFDTYLGTSGLSCPNLFHAILPPAPPTPYLPLYILRNHLRSKMSICGPERTVDKSVLP